MSAVYTRTKSAMTGKKGATLKRVDPGTLEMISQDVNEGESLRVEANVNDALILPDGNHGQGTPTNLDEINPGR